MASSHPIRSSRTYSTTVGILSLLILIVCHGTAKAQVNNSQKLSAEEIIDIVDQRSRGFQDLQANLIMTISDNKSRQYKRALNIRVLEDASPDRHDKSVITFLSPADQKGVALLTHRHSKRTDDQWLYLPALKRLKKITNNTRHSPFMGSDFTYEDLAPLDLNRFRYSHLNSQDAQTDATPSSDNSIYQLIQVPLKEEALDSAYAKRIISIDEHFRIHQIHFFNHQGKRIKQLNINQFKKVKDNRWRPTDMVMTTKLTGTKTRLEWQQMNVGTGLKPAQFTTLSIRKPIRQKQ